MIAELARTFGAFGPETRAVVLTGAGSVFCAGADVQWMKRSAGYSEAENARDAEAMGAMMRTIDRCPCPVIGRINGSALGGGMGLIAACDIVAVLAGAQFGFTEVKLGIVPAVISSFVLRKTGPGPARRYFLTGELFGAEEARAMGLVHAVAENPDALDAKVEEFVRALLQCGPRAVATAKALIREVASLAPDAALEHAIQTIARVRVSPEGQEGLGAFLDKRKPKWISNG
jgi:methylglutaconyl-CoA hydratase